MQWEVVGGCGRLWVDVRRNGAVMGGFEGCGRLSVDLDLLKHF